MRTLVSVFLSWLLLITSFPAEAHGLAGPAGGQTPSSPKMTLKEKVLEIPSGSMVQVQLKAKQKLRGRLGEITNEGFTVKLAKGDTIEDRKIAFEDVKSVKSVEGSKAGRTALYILAGVGIAAGVLIAVGVAMAARD